uniref:Dioxygenase n=1 Tax=Zooxanthella nutricula TaxID=1333877 RepID=A0A7S2Q986_9DINO
MPVEVSLDTLERTGTYCFGREGELPTFTAHPKIDPVTGELIFAAYSSTGVTPVHMGVVGADGLMKHWAPIKSAKRKTLMHDCAITENYTLILDFPLTIDASRALSGGQLVGFEEEPSRIGIVPRYGDDAIRWFTFKPGYGFHTLNAFEDGDCIVLRACWGETMMLSPPWENGKWDREKHMGEYFREGSPSTLRLHEWRMNLEDGSCSERDLGQRDFVDFPVVSPKVVGRPHTYGYSARFDREPSVSAGVAISEALVKYTFAGGGADGRPAVQEHRYGRGVGGQEAVFVPRPGGAEEDDGWLVVFTYDEADDRSELRIIDARDFSGPPAARILMPQRVPYGFHGTFVPS